MRYMRLCISQEALPNTVQLVRQKQRTMSYPCQKVSQSPPLLAAR